MTTCVNWLYYFCSYFASQTSNSMLPWLDSTQTICVVVNVSEHDPPNSLAGFGVNFHLCATT